MKIFRALSYALASVLIAIPLAGQAQTEWTKVADEGGSFTLPARAAVRYGSVAKYATKTIAAGAVKCNNATFGDPLPNVVKACFAQLQVVPVPVANPAGPKVADEGGSFTVSTATSVHYGAGSKWVQKSVTGTGLCTNAFFGKDPMVGTSKACFLAVAPPVPEPPIPPDPPAPPVDPGNAIPGDIVDAAGVIVPAAYVAMAKQMGTEVGISYRYGPSAIDIANPVLAGLPTLYKPTDKFSRCNGTALPDGSNCNTSWQIGGPRHYDATNDQAQAGLYSGNQANLVFVADDPTKLPGVGDLQISSTEFNTYGERPEYLWQCGGCGRISQNFVTYMQNGSVKMDGSARPIATGRCGGQPGFCGSSLVVMQDGTMATAGSTTSRNKTVGRLAANKVPTGIAMTNDSEYALITVWDTVALKGQVAVVALAGLCDGCAPAGPYYEWWHEWRGNYPGLPNMGNIGYVKVMGYVDLPGMMAPTEIAVTTGLDQFKTIMAGGSFIGADNSPLSSFWQNFTPSGQHYGKYAKGGVAVVISKSEQKAIFLDLKPLFSYVNGGYFSAANPVVGQNPGQWPPLFTEAPAALPAVVKTVDLPAKPTAVKTTVTDQTNARAWIATQDGTLRIFSLGGYAPGYTVRSPVASEIVARGTVAVGRNPTSLGTSKGDPANGDPINTQVLVASRGDRKIQWVRFSSDGNSGSVARTLQDSRMVDPIAVEDADNFANKGYTLSVADYSGKKVMNFRYGPVVLADGPGWACQPPGCPVGGGGPIEYGGSFATQGRPFQINTSNVP